MPNDFLFGCGELKMRVKRIFAFVILAIIVTLYGGKRGIPARRKRGLPGVRKNADMPEILCGISLFIQEKFIYFCYNGKQYWNEMKRAR